MGAETGGPGTAAREEKAPAHRLRLPGFVADNDVGLGDAIKHVTYAIGITPCGSCERRATALNRWLQFSAGSPPRGTSKR